MAPDRTSSAGNKPDNSIEKPLAEQKRLDQQPHVAQDAAAPENLQDKTARPTEHGGQQGLEPTRYGDWEKKGRCTDF